MPYATANISVAVRCCGDEVVPNREVSTASCNDLKWDENTRGSQHVCANSDIQGQCLNNLVPTCNALDLPDSFVSRTVTAF